jgi:hypothetical protein
MYYRNKMLGCSLFLVVFLRVAAFRDDFWYGNRCVFLTFDLERS